MLDFAVSDEIDDESDEDYSEISAADDDDRHTSDDDFIDNTPQKNPDVMRMRPRAAARVRAARARGTHPEVSGARGTLPEVAADDDDRRTSDDDFIVNTPQKNPDVMRMRMRPRRSAINFHLLKH